MGSYKYENFINEDGIYTSDFWYDLTDGGYIKPENILTDTLKAEKLNAAIELLME